MMPSWSSESCSSNSETSMPRLSTPRILPTPSVMSLPGMKAPGGTNTPFMPVRALGAPHTTCTGSPVPVSTMHTRRRSALGCWSAEITRAMVNGASSVLRSATFSTSSPIMVSLSTIALSGASVSRCSLSQARVNFIMVMQQSCAQSAREGGKVERTEAVMREPAHVGLEERAQVRHAVFEHRDAVDPHAPGENLHPVHALAEPDLALVALAFDVDLERGLGERKERRPEAHLDLVDL